MKVKSPSQAGFGLDNTHTAETKNLLKTLAVASQRFQGVGNDATCQHELVNLYSFSWAEPDPRLLGWV